MSADLLGWALSNMAWASALALVVLAVRKPFARAFGAGPAYALWLVPAVRLILPPLPQFSIWPETMPDMLPPDLVILVGEDAAAPLPLPESFFGAGPGQWVPILLALWALGAAAFLLWQWLSYRRFVARLHSAARDVGEHRGVPVIESEAADGPLALGLFDRRIVVPADFAARYDAEERRLALEHEAVHHHRGDLWWNHGALLVLALNWFNPIAWAAFRAYRVDQELACDAAVIAASSPQSRSAYAQALVKSASRTGLIAACPLNHADQLKRRLRMMKDHRPSRARRLGGIAALALLAGAGLTLGAPGIAAPIVEDIVDVQATPPAPTPPSTGAAPATGEPRTEHRERIIIRTRDGVTERSSSTSPSGAPAAGGAPEERRERIMIMTRHDGGETVDRQGPTRVIPRLMIEGDCDTGQRTEATEGGTRVILCGVGGTPAERADRLQRARERFAQDRELSDEARTRVLGTLDREIARLRANGN